MSEAEANDREGLRHLRWSMFDSPDAPGSGWRYMERQPVLILDDICTEEVGRVSVKVDYAYLSKPMAEALSVPYSSPHLVGRAVRLRVTNPKARMKWVKHLVLRGVTRIGVGMEHVYFDTENYLLKDALYIQ